MAQTVSGATVAKALNLTERRVQQLVREGMPKEGHGQYDPWACALWYIRYLQKKVEARETESPDGKGASWRDEKKRLLHLQANNEELEYKKRLGDVVPVEMVREKFVIFATSVHDRFVALPSKLAPRLEGERKESIRVKLYESIRDTLNGLSEEPITAKEPEPDPEPPQEEPTKPKKTTGRKNARTDRAVRGGKSECNHQARGGKIRRSA